MENSPEKTTHIPRHRKNGRGRQEKTKPHHKMGKTRKPQKKQIRKPLGNPKTKIKEHKLPHLRGYQKSKRRP